ncbi:hypothetical protein [Streptomyces sp. ISL-43]|uniref:hypothetical protein n=1 Tax=Streptomyces sp. ISL-43 TaxID=2819183 RepID=UPI0035A88ECE
MAGEAARLRGHPSVSSFLIGSDFAPDAEIERGYVDALRAADWRTPVVSAATAASAPLTGASGMRMTGPYDWVPPRYWYDKREGGATGFNSETSAGPSIHTLDTLRRMMSAAELEALWRDPSARQYHRSPSRTFATLKLQGGAYFGAKKANEPLHVQYSYDDRTVAVVNRRHDAASGLTARVSLFTPGGVSKYDRSVRGLAVGGDGAKTTVLTLPAAVDGLPATYLARLVLSDGDGREVSRNVYWLSTRPDVVDYAATDWYHTPTTGYADLTGLRSMPPAPVSATASTTATTPTTGTDPAGTSTTTVTLRHTGSGGAPALLTDVHLVDDRGAPVLPVRWSDNQVSLWPGESATLTATYRTADLHGSAPHLRISGWNTPKATVDAGR